MKKPRKLGQFYLVFKSNAAISSNNFLNRMQKLTSEVRRQKPKIKKNKVMLPNDPEIIEKRNRIAKGIPLDDETLKKLKMLSHKFQVDLKI